MKNLWEDENQVSGPGTPFPGDKAAFDKVWLKIETRLEKRKKTFWESLTWKPLSHPVGWVALAACLCVTLSGAIYQSRQADNNDLVSYVLSLSEPTVDEGRDSSGMVEPVLLTEPSTAGADILLTDENHSDLLPEDETPSAL